MKSYTTEFLRNIALVGHQGAGKTSLAEAMAFSTGAINRMGKIDEGNTVADFDQDEKDRGLSIYTALLALEHLDHKINVMDAPGFVDFQGEAKNAVLVSDAAVLVVDAVSGPEVGTELAYTYAEEFDLPVLVVVNKMDRENANFQRTLDALGERFPNSRFVPVMLPMGSQSDFKGVIDVMNMKAYEGEGKSASEIPGDLVDDAETARLELIEAAAEGDDTLMEKYFETETLTDAEIGQGLRAAGRSVVPVFAMSSTHNVGVAPFLTAVLGFVNPPSVRKVAVEAERGGGVELIAAGDDGAPVVAYVFHSHTDKFGTLTYFRLFNGTIKGNDTLVNLDGDHDERLGSLLTMQGEDQVQLDELHAGDIGVVAKLRATSTGQTLVVKGNEQFVVRPTFSMPIYAVALTPRTQSDSAKMGEILTGMTNADPTLNWYQDPVLRQTILEGMGGTHINVAIKRAEAMGVGLDTAVPKVPYQETITKTAEAEYTHKKQTGGAGQYARVFLRVEPLPTPTGDEEDVPEFEFANEIFGGAISAAFVGSTEKGVRQVLSEGVIAGCPVKYVKAVVYDGKMHPVDSKDIAFQIAGRNAFREAFNSAGPVLLEPIMTVKVTVPEESMGDIMGDMNTRRGRVLGMDTEAGRSIVTAEVPLAEIQRYSNDLRSMTAGRGVYTMEFLRYERIPAHLQSEVIAAAQKEDEEE